MSFHKLDRARDANFWSVRVSRDIRLIVTERIRVCCSVTYDNAYRWAERRKLEAHQKTGAAQLVEVRETVREVAIPYYVEAEQPPSPDGPPELRESYRFSRPELGRIRTALAAELGTLCDEWRKIHGHY